MPSGHKIKGVPENLVALEGGVWIYNPIYLWKKVI